MRLLLDTHALLWWLFDDPRLSSIARQAIAEPTAQVFVSSASAWEIVTKHRLGKLPEAGDVPEGLTAHIREARFTALPVSVEHAVGAGRLPGPHKDPFDRMLIAQAAIEKLPVVTNDPIFPDYGARVIW